VLHDTDLVSIQEVRAKVEKAYAAFQEYRRYSQEQIDAIVEAMGAAGRHLCATHRGAVQKHIALCRKLLERR
jgi:acyl-CoA reductase-like NAD-dependent aldehyde dehydrogenase